MSKETLIQLTPYQTQQGLWGKICGIDGLTKRIDQARRGHLPDGLILRELTDRTDFEAVLGDNFAPRVLIASDPNNPATLIPEQIAIAGGWCALRTKDVATLSEKCMIMDPKTGLIMPVTSVWQVADWIKQSVSFDQIVESVGFPKGAEYAVISEQGLWSRRLAAKLSDIFDRKLAPAEISAIEKAVARTEQARATMTERYLALATGGPVDFRRIVDEDIWDDLRRAKSVMLGRVGLPEWKLIDKFPSESPIIKTSSMVWAMYSEPYFDALRRNGYVTKKTVFIVEPSLHTYADNASGNTVVQTIYQDRGKYFDPKGINPNTGFIAFMECITESGVNVRKNLGVGQVPNISNWRNLFENGTLTPDKNLAIEPRDNKLFVWGLNFLPFGATRQNLLRLVKLQEEFIKEKLAITSSVPSSSMRDPNARKTIQGRVEELRQQMLQRVNRENEQIADALKGLFARLTEGLDI